MPLAVTVGGWAALYRDVTNKVTLHHRFYTVKNIRISFVFVNRRNKEARAHIVSLNYGKLATEYPTIYGYLLQCR